MVSSKGHKILIVLICVVKCLKKKNFNKMANIIGLLKISDLSVDICTFIVSKRIILHSSY